MLKSPSPFAAHIGWSSPHFEGGECVVTLQVEKHHLNMGGWVHGGVLAALLDSTLGGAVVATLKEGEWCATQSLTTDFLRPGEGGRLICRGRVDRRGGLAAYCSGEIRNESGILIARATGVWAVRGRDGSG
ncbi:MAG TPA: PaaI family thioesterase [Candidatus Thermoplasmatota archaeon]|nr:PaaI family thioesterase [Candidatus Thermoplasmatota archaeon]